MKPPLVNWQSVLATEGAAHWNGRSREKEEGKRSPFSCFPFYSSSGTGREYQQATSFLPFLGWLASRGVRSGGERRNACDYRSLAGSGRGGNIKGGETASVAVKSS